MKTKRLPTYRVHAWDWKDSPDAKTMLKLGKEGFTHSSMVSTGSDCYAMVFTKKPVSLDTLQACFDDPREAAPDKFWV